MWYSYGEPSSKTANYEYNGLELTYDEYRYIDREWRHYSKIKIVYLDDKLVKVTSSDYYYDDGTSVRTEYSYDDQSREIEYNMYFDGKLNNGYRNCKYDGLAVTYDAYSYYDGTARLLYSSKIVYVDENYTKVKQSYTLHGDDINYSEYFYDSEGREIGLTQLYNEIPSRKDFDYQYSGSTLTYVSERYDSRGNFESRKKIKREYLN